MGFSVGAAQCLVAPPYALAAIVMYATGWLGDKYHIRGPIIIANMVLCLIGLPIMGFHKNANIRYFGVFLTTAGANSNIPATMSYQANNIRGQWKRAFCSAILVGMGGVGGIAGGLVFRTQDAPKYEPGLYACIACCLLSIVIVGLITLRSWSLNKRADRGEIELEYNDVSLASDLLYIPERMLTTLNRMATRRASDIPTKSCISALFTGSVSSDTILDDIRLLLNICDSHNEYMTHLILILSVI